MTQAYFIELGYEPRFIVSDPYYMDSLSTRLTIDIYDMALPRYENQVIFRVEMDNPKKADKFAILASELVNDWEVDDYYEYDNPYEDYQRTEMIALKGKYTCTT